MGYCVCVCVFIFAHLSNTGSFRTIIKNGHIRRTLQQGNSTPQHGLKEMRLYTEKDNLAGDANEPD